MECLFLLRFWINHFQLDVAVVGFIDPVLLVRIKLIFLMLLCIPRIPHSQVSSMEEILCPWYPGNSVRNRFTLESTGATHCDITSFSIKLSKLEEAKRERLEATL